MHQNSAQFILEDDIVKLLNASGIIAQKRMDEIDLNGLEKALNQNPWIYSAELYLDSQNWLQVHIIQRQPIARLISNSSDSYLIDSSALRLPMNVVPQSRYLVITGFPNANKKLAHIDSVLLVDVKNIANFIYKDSFLNVQIAQININNNGSFSIFPVLGNQKIEIGYSNNLEEKFEKLKLFYDKILLSSGINTYEKIDIRFKNQIVATKFGTEKSLNDSLLPPTFVNDSTVLIKPF